jgi:hypothetical protein
MHVLFVCARTIELEGSTVLENVQFSEMRSEYECRVRPFIRSHLNLFTRTSSQHNPKSTDKSVKQKAKYNDVEMYELYKYCFGLLMSVRAFSVSLPRSERNEDGWLVVLSRLCRVAPGGGAI